MARLFQRLAWLVAGNVLLAVFGGSIGLDWVQRLVLSCAIGCFAVWGGLVARDDAP